MPKKSRFEKGDLVTIKPGIREKSSGFKYPHIGIVVDVHSRNPQNPDWDKLIVLMDGWIDAFPHRRLARIFIN